MKAALYQNQQQSESNPSTSVTENQPLTTQYGTTTLFQSPPVIKPIGSSNTISSQSSNVAENNPSVREFIA